VRLRSGSASSGSTLTGATPVSVEAPGASPTRPPAVATSPSSGSGPVALPPPSSASASASSLASPPVVGSGRAGAGAGAGAGADAHSGPGKMRGGLFHASISDAAGMDRRRALLRSLFDTMDTNKNGVIERGELSAYVRRTGTAEGANPLHHRLCALFLEDGSLDQSFARYVVLVQGWDFCSREMAGAVCLSSQALVVFVYKHCSGRWGVVWWGWFSKGVCVMVSLPAMGRWSQHSCLRKLPATPFD
jgi:hypothetical protein